MVCVVPRGLTYDLFLQLLVFLTGLSFRSVLGYCNTDSYTYLLSHFPLSLCVQRLILWYGNVLMLLTSSHRGTLFTILLSKRTYIKARVNSKKLLVEVVSTSAKLSERILHCAHHLGKTFRMGPPQFITLTPKYFT